MEAAIGVEIEFLHREGGVLFGRRILQRFEELRVHLNDGPVPAGWTPYDFWRVVYDGSLDRFMGGELVTPILQWSDEQSRDDLRRVVKAFREGGATVDKTCGLHVHVGVEKLKEKQVLQIVLLYHRFQSFIESLVANHRIDNRYSMRLEDDLVRRLVSHFQKTGQVATIPKYYGLSTRPISTHGTIEFRMKESTLDPDEVLGWVSFCVDFVKNAAELVEPTSEPVVRQYRASSKAAKFLLDLAIRGSITYEEIEERYGWTRAVAQSYLSEMRSRGYSIKAVQNVIQYEPVYGSFEYILSRSSDLTRSYVRRRFRRV